MSAYCSWEARRIFVEFSKGKNENLIPNDFATNQCLNQWSKVLRQYEFAFNFHVHRFWNSLISCMQIALNPWHFAWMENFKQVSATSDLNSDSHLGSLDSFVARIQSKPNVEKIKSCCILSWIGSLLNKDIRWNWMHKDLPGVSISIFELNDLKPKSAVLFFIHSAQLVLMIQIKKRNAQTWFSLFENNKHFNWSYFLYISRTFTMQINDVNNWMTICTARAYMHWVCARVYVCSWIEIAIFSN